MVKSHRRDCFVNYLKANSKSKCNCPLCKAQLNKREYQESEKLANITIIFKKMLETALVVETYDRKIRHGSQATNGHQTKKRKYNQAAPDTEGKRYCK